ncbi:MAG: hypothetical protein JW918_17025 [Anaerolineae bacterium]|nr:hypothetical protein [Anaerolineae bacterium]
MREKKMEETEKLRVLLPHWIEHNSEHAEEFREWAQKAGPAQGALSDAARLLEQANDRLQEALGKLGGPLEHHHG